jgi:YcxB-like protein
MHIEYRVNERDFLAASKLALRKRSSWSALDYYFPHIFCVVWLAGSVIPSPFNNYLKDDIDLLLTLGVFPIFMGLLVLRRSGMKKEYIKQKNLHLHQALDLDAMGLRLVTTAGTTRTSWDIYSRFVEDKDSFVLFQRADHGIFPIPKDHLSPTQVDELHNLLEARLPSK